MSRDHLPPYRPDPQRRRQRVGEDFVSTVLLVVLAVLMVVFMLMFAVRIMR